MVCWVIRVHVAYTSQCTVQRQWSWPKYSGQPSQDYVSNFATLSNYDNPPTSLFLTLCGDIEENPGPSMDETFSKFEKITSKLEEILASEIQEMARSLNTTTHQVELLTQRLRDTEKDMLDMKKRSSDRERKIEELTLELDRQQIFSRRDKCRFLRHPGSAGRCRRLCQSTS